MSKIPSITEQELQGLDPRGLDQAFLSRLAACAEDTFTELSDGEIAFENSLRSIRPRAIQLTSLDALYEKIGDTPFAVDEKIVLFNKSNQGKAVARKQGGTAGIFSFNFAAAAAVALLGSLAALMLPNHKTQGSPTASGTQVGGFAPLGPSPSNVAPAGYGRTLDGTSDEGVVWRSGTQPFRVLRHTFTERTAMADETGGTTLKEEPRIEYSLIPENVD